MDDIVTLTELMEMQRKQYIKDLSLELLRFTKTNVRDQQDIFKIAILGGYMPRELSKLHHLPAAPNNLIELISDLLIQTNVKSGDSFLDFGSGNGFPIATFASMGFRTYGFDEVQKTIDYCKVYFDRVQREFGEFAHQPIIEKKNFWTCGISEYAFRDGRLVKDMDIFYSYISCDRADSVKTMSQLKGLKKGTVWLDYFHHHIRMAESEPMSDCTIMNTPFRPIDKHYLNSLLIAR